MRGHLSVVTFLPHESPMCSFTLPDIYHFSRSFSFSVHEPLDSYGKTRLSMFTNCALSKICLAPEFCFDAIF